MCVARETDAVVKELEEGVAACYGRVAGCGVCGVVCSCNAMQGFDFFDEVWDAGAVADFDGEELVCWFLTYLVDVGVYC